MMERLLKRGRTIGEARARAVADAIAVRPLPPGISAERTDTGIMISGRGLQRRYVTDAALREVIR
ncbi:MAG: hypothetical protein AABY88_02820 [Pseudomonadota bacterium]